MTGTGIDLSVVVPVYEDPAGIERTLRSLTRQTLPASAYEVIVVDNGSTDETRGVVEEVVATHPDLVSLVIEEEVRGSYAARNTGIEHATGEILAFIDADMTVARAWAASVRSVMAEHSYVGFDVELTASTPTSVVAAYNRQTQFPVERYLTEEEFAPTCCLAVRRAVIETVGTFDERLVSSGDVEFGKRVAAAGFELHFEPSVTMYHPARSARELLSKYVRLGRGFQQRQRLYPEKFDQTPPLNTRNLLPTLSPSRLRASARQVTTKSDVSLGIRGLVVFYVLTYLLSLAVTVGRLDEWWRGESGSALASEPRA